MPITLTYRIHATRRQAGASGIVPSPDYLVLAAGADAPAPLRAFLAPITAGGLAFQPTNFDEGPPTQPVVDLPCGGRTFAYLLIEVRHHGIPNAPDMTSAFPPDADLERISAAAADALPRAFSGPAPAHTKAAWTWSHDGRARDAVVHLYLDDAPRRPVPSAATDRWI